MTADLPTHTRLRRSGTSWLDDVPAHWRVRRLRNVARLRVSNVDKHSLPDQVPVRLCNYVDVYKHDRITAGMSFMQATAAPEDVARFRLAPGDVLITKDSETWDDIAVPALVESSAPDLVCGYHLAILRTFSREALGSYLFRALQSPAVANQFHVAANGVTRFGLSQGAIKSVFIALPPLEEQRAIVRFLDYADQHIGRYIRNKQKLIGLLEEQKRSLIHEAMTRGIDSNAQFTASGIFWLGDLPAHWSTSRSKRLFRPRKELARPDDVQLSATQAYGVIPQADYEARIGRKVTKITMHLDKRRHVELGDFVISMRSFQGGLERAWATGCIRSSYVVLEHDSSIDVDFFAYLFKSPGYIRALQSTGDFIRDGQDLTFDNFAAVDLPVPPLEEQRLIARRITDAVSGIAVAADRAVKGIALLNEYRTRLIADVLIGKLDVQEAAAGLPEHVDETADVAFGLDMDGEPDELDIEDDSELEEVEA